MTMKFHVNNDGDVGRCKAEIKCDFGGDERHFSTRSEAKEASEAIFAGEFNDFLTSNSKKPLSEKLLDDPILQSFTYDAKTIRSMQEDVTLDFTEPIIDEEINGIYSAPSELRMDLNEVRERKNRGEYSEALFAAKLLSDAAKDKKNELGIDIAAVRFGGSSFVIDKQQELVKMRTADGEVFKYKSHNTDLESAMSEVAEGSYKKVSSTFESPATARLIAQMGHKSGLLPKAPSTSKADMVIWDKAGNRIPVSVKSYLNSKGYGQTALFNVSVESSAMDFQASSGHEITDEELQKLNEEIAIGSVDSAMRTLKNKGITFDSSNAQASAAKFGDNLKIVSPQGEKAFADAILKWANSNGAPSVAVDESLSEDYSKVIGAFATRMTPTAMQKDEDAVKALGVISKAGGLKLVKIESEKQIGEYLRKRLSFSENASVTGPRKLKRIDGKLVLSLNVFGAISENPKKN